MGIFYDDVTVHNNWKHGDSHAGKVTALYRVWGNLKERCFNKEGRDYALYGAKGIGMQRSWLEYKVFRTWAHESGYKKGLVMSRIKKDVGFYPHNIEWLTRSEEAIRTNASKRAFTWETIQFIRSSKITGVMIAKVFKVSTATINNIRHFRTYKKDVK